MAMTRTTIMADDALLDQLRAIAREEGVSLAEVIRQGLEWRARTRRRVPSFVGAISSVDRPHDTARDDEELIAEYIREKHARR
jgi:hypothetical protein